MCPRRLSGGGESQNEAKSRRFGMDMPSRAFYEGVHPKTILNNCHEYTKMHLNPLPTTPFDFAITPSAGWCCPILPDITHQLPFGILEVFSGHTQ